MVRRLVGALPPYCLYVPPEASFTLWIWPAATLASTLDSLGLFGATDLPNKNQILVPAYFRSGIQQTYYIRPCIYNPEFNFYQNSCVSRTDIDAVFPPTSSRRRPRPPLLPPLLPSFYQQRGRCLVIGYTRSEISGFFIKTLPNQIPRA